MADVNIIGDEIWMDGYLVAMIVDRTPEHIVLNEFVSGLANATLFEGEVECACCDGTYKLVHKKDCKARGAEDIAESDEVYDTALDDLLKAARLEARGGLIRIITLERIILQLKENES